MSEVWGLAEDDLLSLAQIAKLLPGLVIEKAVVRRLENAFSADDPRAHETRSANVAFVRARRP